jgi:hypothetical protein
MLYHFVLTYSNWETAVLCYSETFESLSHGLQTALWELGGVPACHRTDRLSAAVKNLSNQKEFTKRYECLMDHYSLNGDKTNPSSPHENGDVEQAHRRLYESMDQALMLRGSRDFASVAEYESFVRETLHGKNLHRGDRMEIERRHLRPLPATRLDHRRRVDATVTTSSLIRFDSNVYSVPSRLIGESVRLLVDVEWIDVYYAQQRIERLPRLRGRHKSRVNFRHIIDWLVRKPGAFANYRYQADLFPTTRFRLAYDELLARESRVTAAKQYIEILHMAAHEGEQLIDDALRILIKRELSISAEQVRTHLQSAEPTTDATDVYVEPARLTDFDDLFHSMETWTDECQRISGVAIEGTSLADLSGTV